MHRSDPLPAGSQYIAVSPWMLSETAPEADRVAREVVDPHFEEPEEEAFWNRTVLAIASIFSLGAAVFMGLAGALWVSASAGILGGGVTALLISVIRNGPLSGFMRHQSDDDREPVRGPRVAG